jgi:L-malate glycosyltransferase
VTPAIVHVASGREWRGGQRQVWLLARALGRLGIDQVVVTGKSSELARRLDAAGVRVRAVRWSAGLDPRVLPAIISELRPPGVILHAHDAHALTLGGFCAGLMRVPLVVTRRVDFHLRRLGYWGRAEGVIAISNAIARILADDGVSPKRITVVHSGIALETLQLVPRLGIRERLGLPPGAQVVANVAALVPHKDHATLVNAAKVLKPQFPDLHWVVAGQGELRRMLEAQIAELGLTGRVHLMGHLDAPERLIADSDLFVMSSQEEGLGTTVLEAMALGIPIASTSAGGLPELLGDGAGVLVPARTPEALADAVARILEDTELRQQLIDRAKVKVLRFTDQRMAEQVLSVYRSCVHSLEGS